MRHWRRPCSTATSRPAMPRPSLPTGPARRPCSSPPAKGCGCRSPRSPSPTRCTARGCSPGAGARTWRTRSPCTGWTLVPATSRRWPCSTRRRGPSSSSTPPACCTAPDRTWGLTAPGPAIASTLALRVRQYAASVQPPRSICWDSDAIVVLDQTALPHERRMLRLTTCDELVDAIKRLAVRGAPALGVAGALGVALSARRNTGAGPRTGAAGNREAAGDTERAVRAEAARIADARPTAVNLRWGVARALARLADGPDAVLAEALAVLAEDERTNRAAATRAADVVLRLCHRAAPLRVLTHCNTGMLATSAWGTALGAIRELWLRGAL